MRKSDRLPTRFPAGAKYVLEGRGTVIHRYVELPGGGRVMLSERKAVRCHRPGPLEVSLVPAAGLRLGSAPARKPAKASPRRARVLETA